MKKYFILYKDRSTGIVSVLEIIENKEPIPSIRQAYDIAEKVLDKAFKSGSFTIIQITQVKF